MLQHLKEFILISIKDKNKSNSGDATIQELERIQGVVRKISLYLTVHRVPFMTMPIIHHTHEERSLFHLGLSMPTSIWRLQEILMNLHILIASVFKKKTSFLIYGWAIDHAQGTLLAQNNELGHEQAIYYWSFTMIGVEHSYNPIEKECLAFVFTI